MGNDRLIGQNVCSIISYYEGIILCFNDGCPEYYVHFTVRVLC